MLFNYIYFWFLVHCESSKTQIRMPVYKWVLSNLNLLISYILTFIFLTYYLLKEVGHWYYLYIRNSKCFEKLYSLKINELNQSSQAGVYFF